MAQENFSDQGISEQVRIRELPVFMAGRLSWSRSTQSGGALKEAKGSFQNINIQKLLMGMEPCKAKAKDASKSREKRTVSKGGSRCNDKREVKMIQLREEKERKELENCTFQPNTHLRQEKKRTLQQFLDEQQIFVRKANAKKQLIKQHLNEKQRHEFRPSINASHQARDERPIYERLYGLREKEEVLVPVNKEERFRPSISSKSKKMVREQQIGKHLYEDALRRQSKKSEPTIYKCEEKSVNLTNEKYVAQKFIKELYNVLGEMSIDLESGLDYLSFNQLLFRLGFVTHLEEVENKSATAERALVYEAYSLLSQTYPSIKNICLFLLALIGVYHIDPINFTEGETSNNVGFNLDEAEGRKLQKHFDLLYRNRLFAESSRKSSKTQESVVYSFKPEINPESEVMAGNFRNKILKETASLVGHMDIDLPHDGIKHTDLLVLNRITKQKLREEMRVQKQEKQLKECTFKPNIIDKKHSNSNTSFDQGSSKCLQLYNLHKKRLSKNQIQEEKGRLKDTQCTFAPQLYPKSTKSVTIPRNSDKQVFRMLQSRKQKQEISRFLSRGYDKTSVEWKKPQEGKQSEEVGNRVEKVSLGSQEEEESPFLVIDVNLGTHVDHITLFREDIDRADVLAEQFASKHHLDQETKERLVDLLYQQINSMVLRIEEENEE